MKFAALALVLMLAVTPAGSQPPSEPAENERVLRLLADMSPREYKSLVLRQLQFIRNWWALDQQCVPGFSSVRFWESSSHPSWLTVYHTIQPQGEALSVCSVRVQNHASLNKSCRLVATDGWHQLVDTLDVSEFWLASSSLTHYSVHELNWTLAACINGRYHSVRTQPERESLIAEPINAVRAVLESEE